MKKELSTPVLTGTLLLFSGILFPLIFALIDKFLRSLFVLLDPILLMFMSFSWLLFLYFYGIKFSLTYITDEFIIKNKSKLFTYSNIGFALIAGVFYYSLVSASVLSNLIWGLFYLGTMGLFYFQSTKAFST